MCLNPIYFARYRLQWWALLYTYEPSGTIKLVEFVDKLSDSQCKEHLYMAFVSGPRVPLHTLLSLLLLNERSMREVADVRMHLRMCDEVLARSNHSKGETLINNTIRMTCHCSQLIKQWDSRYAWHCKRPAWQVLAETLSKHWGSCSSVSFWATNRHHPLHCLSPILITYIVTNNERSSFSELGSCRLILQ